ncbi:MAG: PQQ-binding-like beta-propeller repeat protein [Candidatus Cybelea sp.]
MRPLSVALFISICVAGCAYSQGISPSNVSSQVTMPTAGGQSKSKTVPVLAGGGGFALPRYGGFKGKVPYSPSDATSGATLTFTNSGSNNLLGVPAPPNGTPVLYLEASIGVASEVTFASGSSQMKLESARFQTGGTYEIYAYEGGQQVESYGANPPKNDTLAFLTPLSGVMIPSTTPLAIEVVLSGTASPSPSPSPTPTTTDWDSFGFDLQRTGYNPVESEVGANNIGSVQMVWTLNIGSNMVHEPVYAAGVNVNGQPANILYAGSAYGSTMYAINASTGAIVWQDPVPFSTFSCGSQKAKFSIDETPAIDRGKNLLYFADGYNQVHAVDLGTGREAAGWPVTIADYTPDHNFMHGGLTYNAADGILYGVTGSTCDISPWYGRIVAVLTTLHPVVVGSFFTMSGGPSQGSSGGGIWGPGGGSVDPSTGNVFVATGNADTSQGGEQNAGDAEQVIELPPALGKPIANNYPPNIPEISGDDDFDFGATPLLFQPAGCPPLVAAINKSGVFELYDRGSISQGPIQYIYMSVPTDRGDFIGVPAFDPVTGYVYVGLPTVEGIYQPGLAAFNMQYNCTLNPTPAWTAEFGPDGYPYQTSRRSAISIANGVVYISNFTGDTEYAFNAATGAQLWEQPLAGWGNEGTVIANGMVFVSSDDGTISAWAPLSDAQKLRKHVVKTSEARPPVRRPSPATPWGPWSEPKQRLVRLPAVLTSRS